MPAAARLALVLLSLAALGCAGKAPPAGDDDDDDPWADSDAGPRPRDAGPGGGADGGTPRPPDAAPMPAAYPAGPYGTRTGRVIENLGFMGYADGADSGGDPFDDAPRRVELEEFFQGRDPASRVLLVNSASGWCGACQEEAAALRGIAAQYTARGARFLTALEEDPYGSPADVAFAREWGQQFDLTFATVADPGGTLTDYYVESATPMNMFIDTRTMTIVEVHHGFDPGETRGILDAYVD